MIALRKPRAFTHIGFLYTLVGVCFLSCGNFERHKISSVSNIFFNLRGNALYATMSKIFFQKHTEPICFFSRKEDITAFSIEEDIDWQFDRIIGCYYKEAEYKPSSRKYSANPSPPQYNQLVQDEDNISGEFGPNSGPLLPNTSNYKAIFNSMIHSPLFWILLTIMLALGLICTFFYL
ncbi:hypothetical protein NEFER03_0442 [Nematocida sp. LUAm3]|nr:hypothetical protein NEFER03_0442 [Nematocida sp. LUAm3]KAI5175900.1 hypothetical protein NEFER02_1760 [Nematocida sp. LUAm2]KAI5178718.1 hypothetical protein NEFER01_1837 [Nematocida sp. LUAm1]